MYCKAYHINNIILQLHTKTILVYSTYSTYTTSMAVHKKYIRSHYLVYPSGDHDASTLFLYMETEDLFACTRHRRLHSNTYTFIYTHQHVYRIG